MTNECESAARDGKIHRASSRLIRRAFNQSRGMQARQYARQRKTMPRQRGKMITAGGLAGQAGEKKVIAAEAGKGRRGKRNDSREGRVGRISRYETNRTH